MPSGAKYRVPVVRDRRLVNGNVEGSQQYKYAVLLFEIKLLYKKRKTREMGVCH